MLFSFFYVYSKKVGKKLLHHFINKTSKVFLEKANQIFSNIFFVLLTTFEQFLCIEKFVFSERYEKNHLTQAIFAMLFRLLGTNYPYLI